MKKVLLRPPRPGDEKAFIAAVKASRRHHEGWVKPPATPAAFRAWLKRCKADDYVGMLACRAADGAIVGVFNLGHIVRGPLRSAYMGYYGMAQYAGQGYMTRALALMVRHTFRVVKLHRVEANIQPGNVRSIALVRRGGFRLEGFSPRYLKIHGKWRDHQRWAITSD